MFEQFFGQGLSEKIAVYIPSTVNVSESAGQELIDGWVTAAHKFLAGQFGGATSQSALGSYVTDSGFLVTEQIVIVYAYAKQITPDNVNALLDFVGNIKAALGQESIGIEVNGTLFFG